MAAVRNDGPRTWVEYPLGNTIYEQAKTSINLVRVSPDGALIATLEQEAFGGGQMWAAILDRKGAVLAVSGRKSSTVLDSLAWTPDSQEIWFAGAAENGRADVHALRRDGTERIVYRAIGSVRVQDIASDGRALRASDTFRADMNLVDVGEHDERDLTLKNWSRPFSLSNDGAVLGFGDGGRGGRPRAYVRRTDGTPAVLVSESGHPIAISPDGKWVLTSAGGVDRLSLVPTGARRSRDLEAGSLVGFSVQARWLPDNRRIVFVGREADRRPRVFIQSLDGGPPSPLTPENAQGPRVVSPDGAFVVVRDTAGQLAMFPIAGGTPIPLSGALREDQPLAWSSDGRSMWLLNRSTTPARIFKLDVRTASRTLWREVPYADPASIEPESLRVYMSADGSKFVYGYQKQTDRAVRCREVAVNSRPGRLVAAVALGQPGFCLPGVRAVGDDSRTDCRRTGSRDSGSNRHNRQHGHRSHAD